MGVHIPVREGALLKGGHVPANCNVPTHSEYACPAYTADECIRHHDGLQNSHAASCQITLDTYLTFSQ